MIMDRLFDHLKASCTKKHLIYMNIYITCNRRDGYSYPCDSFSITNRITFGVHRDCYQAFCIYLLLLFNFMALVWGKLIQYVGDTIVCFRGKSIDDLEIQTFTFLND